VAGLAPQVEGAGGEERHQIDESGQVVAAATATAQIRAM
jgi:hypothetical protein